MQRSERAPAHEPGRARPGSRTPRKDVVRNRSLLLAAADDLIRENGMDLSLNAVARRAGVGVGTVYRHFPDRAALVQALFDQRITTVRGILSAHLAAPDPVEGLRAAVLAVCESQVVDRGVWEALSSASEPHYHETVVQRLQPLSGQLVRRAKDASGQHIWLEPTDFPVILWLGGALNDFLGPVSSTAWRRYVGTLLDSMLFDQRPVGAGPQEPSLTFEQLSEVITQWRPRGAR